ncbi:hypothetical protein G9G63_26050 [Paenibacillus sp. EKM202P]|nr:hypothetical protein G9G63_26050 [Paenibacillus sp. EKM202P]KAF6563223.1 hypothetical protein G9G64_25935 [Paenibacillus sp. EKM207P]QOH64582.1 hypothetical protein DI243_07740 [Paenibacillus polymyxa]
MHDTHYDVDHIYPKSLSHLCFSYFLDTATM